MREWYDAAATPHQLMSIFGWLTLAEAERYTRAAEQKKLATDAIQLLERKDAKSVLPPGPRVSHPLIELGKFAKWRPVEDRWRCRHKLLIYSTLT
jgi:hypothetical protein